MSTAERRFPPEPNLIITILRSSFGSHPDPRLQATLDFLWGAFFSQSMREFPSLSLRRRQYAIGRTVMIVAGWCSRQETTGTTFWTTASARLVSTLDRETKAQERGLQMGRYGYWLPKGATDLVLIAGLGRRRGDAAYRKTVLRFRDRWLRIAKRRLEGVVSDEREDVVHQALVTLLHPVTLFVLRDGTIGRLSCAIVLEQIRAAQRHKTKVVPSDQMDQEPGGTCVDEETLVSRRNTELVRRVMSVEPALEDKLWTDRTFEELATQYGGSGGTLAQRWSDLRELLRRIRNLPTNTIGKWDIPDLLRGLPLTRAMRKALRVVLTDYRFRAVLPAAALDRLERWLADDPRSNDPSGPGSS
jgi:hypothetical protein